MNKLSALAAVALLAVAGVGAAHAQSNGQPPIYVEGGYTFGEIKAGGDTANPDQIRGIVGWDVHPNVAFELMLGLGARSDSDQGVKVKLERGYGVYVKPNYSFTPKFNVFARLGYADTKVKLSYGGASASSTEGSVSWAIGASYKFAKNIYGVVDYSSLRDKDGVEVNGITLGAGYRF